MNLPFHVSVVLQKHFFLCPLETSLPVGGDHGSLWPENKQIHSNAARSVSLGTRNVLYMKGDLVFLCSLDLDTVYLWDKDKKIFIICLKK